MNQYVKAAFAGAATAIIGLTILSVFMPTPAKAYCMETDPDRNDCVNKVRAPIELLKKHGYPSQIIVKDRKLWSQAKNNWTMVGSKCDRVLRTGDKTIATIQYNYCFLHSRGYWVAKPKLIKGF